jgi:hypothetical protein
MASNEALFRQCVRDIVVTMFPRDPTIMRRIMPIFKRAVRFELGKSATELDATPSVLDVGMIYAQLSDPSIAHIDLAGIERYYIRRQEPIARDLGPRVSPAELDILEVYDRLSDSNVASLDLDGLGKYHFHHKRYNTMISATTNGGRVTVVDNKNRVLFVANPNVFFGVFSEKKIKKTNVTTLADFHKFPELPGELRHRIWALAAEPRCLIGTEVCTRSLKDFPFPFSQVHIQPK